VVLSIVRCIVLITSWLLNIVNNINTILILLYNTLFSSVASIYLYANN